MDLDKTYCASHCKNYKCPLMLRYSVLMAAEKREVEVKYDDLSPTCPDYMETEKCENV